MLAPTPEFRLPLALVLPCYHPPRHWVSHLLDSLSRLRPLLPAHATLHVYLVNDGTTLAAADINQLREALPNQFTYLAYPHNHGKGHALRMGMAQVQEPYCVFTDIDFPYQEHSVAAVYEALLSAECDLAVGVRDAAYYAHVPAARRRVSRLLRRLTRRTLSLPTDDTQCGLKGVNETGRAVFLRTTIRRYLFDLELLFLASRTPGLRVAAVPVELKPGVVFSRLNSRILATEGFNFLRILSRQLRG